MQKIISLFKRDYDSTRHVYDEVAPGAEWVQSGEGRATRKWDGTCCMVRDGVLYKRYDAKHGKAPPPDFEPAQSRPDEHTGHWPGWVPVKDGTDDRWHREAVAPDGPANCGLLDGTYELVGPKIQHNDGNWTTHRLIPHGRDLLDNVPTDFDGLRAYLVEMQIEGIVWHHPDGRLVKIKRKDFGLPWPIK